MPKLLIIDDDPDFSGGLALALELDDYQVAVVSNGEDGIAAVSAAAYDVILLDIGLPGLSGVETLLRIKQIRSGTRCFLLTGYSAADLVAQGIDAGAVEVFTKPVDVEHLLKRMAQM